MDWTIYGVIDLAAKQQYIFVPGEILSYDNDGSNVGSAGKKVFHVLRWKADEYSQGWIQTFQSWALGIDMAPTSAPSCQPFGCLAGCHGQNQMISNAKNHHLLLSS